MVEFNSIAKGIYAADQMAKISEVEFAAATSTCPGKYIAIVHGDVAAVEDSVRIGERMAGEFFDRLDSSSRTSSPGVSRRSPAGNNAGARAGRGHHGILLAGDDDRLRRCDPQSC